MFWSVCLWWFQVANLVPPRCSKIWGFPFMYIHTHTYTHRYSKFLVWQHSRCSNAKEVAMNDQTVHYEWHKMFSQRQVLQHKFWKWFSGVNSSARDNSHCKHFLWEVLGHVIMIDLAKKHIKAALSVLVPIGFTATIWLWNKHLISTSAECQQVLWSAEQRPERWHKKPSHLLILALNLIAKSEGLH